MEALIGRIILMLLALLGAAEIIRLLVLWAVTPERSGNMLIVVPICGHNEEAELILRSAVQRLRWLGTGKVREVLCVDCGMDEQTRRVCEIVCGEDNCVRMIKLDEIEEVFRCKKEENVLY